MAEEGLLKYDITETMKSIIEDFSAYEIKEIGILRKALKVSGKIIEKWGCPEAFTEMIKMLASAGLDEKDIWEEATSIAKTITDTKNIVRAYRFIAIGFSNIGFQVQAEICLKNAMSLTESIENEYVKYVFLKEAAIGYGEIGLFERALSIGKTIDAVSIKAEVFSFIAFKMAQSGLMREAEIILKHAFDMAKTDTSFWNKSDCLSSIAYWVVKGRDEDKIISTASDVFEIIDTIPDISDKLSALRELIRRTMIQPENKPSELFKDVIEDKAVEYINEIETKIHGDNDINLVLNNAVYILENAGVLEPEPWQTVIRLVDRISREHEKSRVLNNAAYALAITGIKDESIILLFEKLAGSLSSAESISEIYNGISRLYNACGNIGMAMEALDKIKIKEIRLAADARIIYELIINEKIDEEADNVCKLIKIFRDDPEYFSKVLFPNLINSYYPENREEIETLLSFYGYNSK
ncbi:hypothetical protein ES705_43392 [subsurface metagenome]